MDFRTKETRDNSMKTSKTRFVRVVLGNKLLLFSIIVFAVWVGWLDEYSFYAQSKLKNKIEQLEERREVYKENIRNDSLFLVELNSSNEFLERFARERYFMKKSGETIFTIK